MIKMASGLSPQAMPTQMNYAIHEAVGKRTQEQQRSLMYVVADFLRQQGLMKTCETLAEEAQLSSNYQIADNIDLQIILSEYTDYYHSRFQKWPQICKQVENSSSKDSPNLPKACCQTDNNTKPKPQDSDEIEESLPAYPGLTVTPVSPKDAISSAPSDDISPVIDGERVLRPLGNLYPAGSESKAIAESITRECVATNVDVDWDDVYGLKKCKMLLEKAIVYPMKYPQYFDSAFTPSKGILLYGPTGTGKTMLAKATATKYDLTFFNVTASSLVSKLRVDPEKYVRVLFELASYHAPSVIFIDEIDWIAGSDKSETARRFRVKTPWSLDSSLLRRLETHIHVDVPDFTDRQEILEVYTEKTLHYCSEFSSVLQQTDGYSFADLKRLCKEAWTYQIQLILSRLENAQSNEKPVLLDIPKLVTSGYWLLQSVDHILSTAKQQKGECERWEASLKR